MDRRSVIISALKNKMLSLHCYSHSLCVKCHTCTGTDPVPALEWWIGGRLVSLESHLPASSSLWHPSWKPADPNNPSNGISLARLSCQDPILFYAEVSLFENELHDNGASSLFVKIILFFFLFHILHFIVFTLRVDNVLFDRRTHVFMFFRWVRKEELKYQSYVVINSNILIKSQTPTVKGSMVMQASQEMSWWSGIICVAIVFFPILKESRLLVV